MGPVTTASAEPERVRAFDQRCRAGDTVHARNTCGLELRAGMGFPDDDCPAESPLAEFNAQDDTVPEAAIGAGDEKSGHGESLSVLCCCGSDNAQGARSSCPLCRAGPAG